MGQLPKSENEDSCLSILFKLVVILLGQITFTLLRSGFFDFIHFASK